MPSCYHTVRPSERGIPLIEFLAQRLSVSRRKAKALLDARAVWVNQRRVWMARHVLAPYDEVEIVMGPLRPAPRTPLPVLYEDADWIIANKPPGLLSNGPDSVEERLGTQTGNPRLRAAHRLDRETSGCLLLAKTEAAFALAVRMIRERRMLKIYHGIVAGCLRTSNLIINRPLDGEQAMTRVRTLNANRLASHLAIRLETGRTHQIRRHLAGLCHPVLGDRRYGGSLLAQDPYRTVPRQMLHAAVLEFRSPRTGETLRVQAALPADLRDCLRTFRLS